MSILKHNNLNSRPVGFFDSGVGGLSVYARFRKALPHEDCLYFGDLANMPYGNKSREDLIGFARRILDFYNQKEVKAVVIACNTSSAQAYDTVKDEYRFKIYPIIQSCAKVIASANYGKIGVFATEATVKSGVYTTELQKYNSSLEVKEISCPNWVPIVENNRYTDKSAIEDVKNQVSKILEFSPDRVILGCTHYPYLMPLLKDFAPEELFIDPAEIFVNYISTDLESNGLLNEVGGTEQFFVSANPESFKSHSRIFYQLLSPPVLV